MSQLTDLCKSKHLSLNQAGKAGYVLGDFFRGNVILTNQGLINAKFKLEENGTIIKVKNSLYLRLTPTQFGFPFAEIPFELVAPLEAVKIQQGIIPDNYISSMSAEDYLNLKIQYYS